MRRVELISKQHTTVLKQWLSEGAYVKFVGDNVDRYLGVRDLRSDNHGEMKHMFSLLAIKSRVTPPATVPHCIGLRVDVTQFLPTAADIIEIKRNLHTLVSRIACHYVKGLQKLKKLVPAHITHAYSEEMTKKSEVIVLDVLHKNENKSSDMVAIMREMASYLGESYERTALSGGDHLTCEREQSARRHVVCSNTRAGRLEQLEPCIEDWHCVMNFMMVCMFVCTHVP